MSGYALVVLTLHPATPLVLGQSNGAVRGAGQMNISAFGELPARFNGRVTTMDVVARAMLKRCSDRDVFVDAEGKQQPAVRWFLDVITGGSDEHRVVPIENAELLELLDLDKPRKATPRRGGDAATPLYSIAELKPRVERIDEKMRRIQRDGANELDDEYEASLSNLYSRIQLFALLTAHLRLPEANDAVAARQMVQFVDDMDPYALFRMVPAGEAPHRWQTLVRSEATLRITALLKAQPNRAAHLMQAILAAYREQDTEEFNERLSDYRKWIEAQGIAKSPVEFDVPPSWRETGVVTPDHPQFFGSVLANGQTVAEFDIGKGDLWIKAFLRHFTGRTMSDAQIVNDWRVGFGLMPLAEKELAKTGTPITIAGHDVRYFDLIPTDDAETLQKRTLGAIVRHGKHTFLINVGLPDEVTDHLQTFESFAGSLKLASDEELSRWFPDSPPADPMPLRTTAVALVPDQTRLWSLQLVESTPEAYTTPHRKAFDELIRTITPSDDSEKKGIQWTDPKNWRRDPPGPQPIYYAADDRSTAAFIAVYAIGDAKNADRLPLVNLWRIQAGLPAWRREEMVEASQEIRVAGRTVTLLEFEALPKPETASPQPAAAELTYETPQGWVAGKASPFRKASFQVKQGAQQADISVVALPASENSWVANVNRWRAQLQLDPLAQKAVAEATKKTPIGHGEGNYLDIRGDDGRRILAAVAVRGDQEWWFKMMGDEKSVGEQEDNFKAFLKSIHFAPEPARQ